MFDSRARDRAAQREWRLSLCKAAGIAPGAKPDGLLQGALAVMAGQGIAKPDVGIQLIGNGDPRLIRDCLALQE